MYKTFFGLKESPFRLTCDPDLLMLTPKHREALVGLTYAILDGREISVLLGEAGTGKTTLLAGILKNLPTNRVRSSVVFNPTLTREEFLELVMLDFGFEQVPASKAQRLVMLQRFLVAGHKDNKISLLVVDEAHKLTPELLEEIRLLSNFDYGDRKLLQIVLVGQPKMDDLLNQNDLRQVKQRISLRFTLDPFSSSGVELYIQHRWSKCGGGRHPFTPEAVARIAGWSHGIPRVVNAICENALLSAFAAGRDMVDDARVAEACADLGLARRAVAQANGNGQAHQSTAPAVMPTNGNGHSSDPPPPAIERPVEPLGIPTLNRQIRPAGGSLLARWAGRLGLATGKI